MQAVSENRTILKDATGAQLIVAEQSTLQMTATLLDEVSMPVPLAGLSTLTLTLYSRDSVAQDIINNVSATNMLNAGRGTVHPTTGLLTITLLPADNAIVDGTKDLEWHRALIQGTYGSGGSRAFKYEIDFPVRNVAKVS